MAFGVVAAIITWWVYPLLERWIARVPQSIMNIIAVVIIIFGATIFSLYIIEPPEYIKQRQMKNASVYQTSMITQLEGRIAQKRGAPR
jgi:predicted PurR-regulated permease PerM